MFTPDGSRIVFERYAAATDTDAIWSMDLTGGDRQEIIGGPRFGATDPNVSPDGTTVSLIEFNGEDLEQALSTSSLNGSDPRQLMPFTTDVAVKQDWAPNGHRLVFTDNADNFEHPANIATIRPNGTGLRYLTH